MRTSIDIPDKLMKEAKIKAVKEGITLKELVIRSLEKELDTQAVPVSAAPWKKLAGKGSASALQPSDSGFEGYPGPDWNHGVGVNEPDN
jgi:hypothetical protein